MLPLYYNVTLMPMVVMVCYAEDVPTEHAQHFIIILMGLCGVVGLGERYDLCLMLSMGRVEYF